MSNQGNERSRRVWTAEEIEEQLDEIGKVLSHAPGEILRGFLFGPGPRRRREPTRREEQHDGK